MKQPWPNDGSIQQIYQTAYQQALIRRPILKKLLAQIVDKDDFQILTDIKRLGSFVNKVSRGKEPNEIHDVLRAVILTNSPEENGIVADRINDMCDVVEQEFKTENDSGYRGAYHFKILLAGMTVEIQTMSRTLWAYKEAAHPGYERQKHGQEDSSLLSFSNWLYDTALKSEPSK